MGKYGEALGIWELRVGKAELDLKPKKGDNLKLSKILSEARKRKDDSWMMEQMVIFIKGLIERDYPPLNEDETKELDEYVEFNLLELIKETLVAFRWTTKEAMEKIEEKGVDELKKVMLQEN